MADNSKPVAMEFRPAASDEGLICTGCPLKNNCPYPDGMECASIRAVRMNRATEMRATRKCALSNQFRTYDILGGFTVTRWYNKKHSRVIAKIRSKHPTELFPLEKNSCKCVVTFRALERNDDGKDPEDILIDFSDQVILEYGYANMPAIRKRLMDEIHKWYTEKS